MGGEVVAARLDADTLEKLEEWEREHAVHRSDALRKLIRKGLEKENDRPLWRQATSAIKGGAR